MRTGDLIGTVVLGVLGCVACSGEVSRTSPPSEGIATAGAGGGPR